MKLRTKTLLTSSLNLIILGLPTPALAETYICEACPAGTYDNGASCVVCPAGKYSDASGAVECKTCAAGSKPNATKTGCDKCPVGTYDNGTSCVACPAGKYNDTSGAVGCKTCAAGSKPNATKTGCDKCPAGTYDNATSCVACPAGKYNTTVGKASCNACPAGSYCPSGSVNPIICPVGKFSIAGAATCTGCHEDKFGTPYGKCGISGVEKTSYCSKEGSTSSVANPVGPVVVYKNLEEKTPICTGHTYCKITDESGKANGGSYCAEYVKPYNATWVSETGPDWNCSANYYKQGDECAPCPAHSNSPAGSTSIDNCVCEENYYRSGNMCKLRLYAYYYSSSDCKDSKGNYGSTITYYQLKDGSGKYEWGDGGHTVHGSGIILSTSPNGTSYSMSSCYSGWDSSKQHMPGQVAVSDYFNTGSECNSVMGLCWLSAKDYTYTRRNDK